MSSDDTRDLSAEQRAGAGRDPESPAPRRDLDDGLRFLHVMAMQGQLATERVEVMLSALLAALEAAGIVTEAQVREHIEAAKEEARERAAGEPHVAVAQTEDKYALADLPDIDCEALLPLCKGRCCQLVFPLSFQDLDERVVEWNYSRPYTIRQRASDGYCVHSDETARTCTIYEHRPGVCRVYDCRQDARIWVDFANRIPAPLAAIRGQPAIIKRIGVGKPDSRG